MTLHAMPQKLQRAVGQITLRSKHLPGGATGLNVLRQSGSSKAVFPRPRGDYLEAVLVNTAGGVTGGDRFEVSVHAAAQTCVSVTTQAAERIYAASSEDTGRIRTTLVLEDGARLNWLPQETILFDGSRLTRRLDVEVAEGARFLMVEPLVFGRTQSGESLRFCAFSDTVSIQQRGLPLYLDQARMSGDVAAALRRPAVAAGGLAMASVVLVAPDAGRYLTRARDLLPQSGGASLVNACTLAVRVLCADSFELRSALLPLLTYLTDDTLPKNWRL